jgi:hypothetical protein
LGADEEHALLGTARDQAIARKLGRSVSAVRSRRLHITQIKFKRTPRRWMPKELALDGQAAGCRNCPPLEPLSFRRATEANPPRHPGLYSAQPQCQSTPTNVPSTRSKKQSSMKSASDNASREVQKELRNVSSS